MTSGLWSLTSGRLLQYNNSGARVDADGVVLSGGVFSDPVAVASENKVDIWGHAGAPVFVWWKVSGSPVPTKGQRKF